MKAHVVALNCMLNACIVMACADVQWDSQGVIQTCDVYVAYEWDFLIEHELRHCQGYADVFY